LILLVAAIGVLWVARALRACLSQFHERGLFWGEMHNHRELIFQGVDAAPLLRIDASTTSVPWLLVDRDRIEPSVSYDAGLLTSAILGSCAWLGARYFGDSDNTAYASIIIVFLILMTALLRWAVYHGFPPISLRGRLRTGHWIIPAHDRAVLVPIGIVLCGLAAWSVLTLCPISGALAHSLTFTLVVAIAFCAGPTHGVHRLTGA
jgi:hypothetical protein